MVLAIHIPELNNNRRDGKVIQQCTLTMVIIIMHADSAYNINSYHVCPVVFYPQSARVCRSQLTFVDLQTGSSFEIGHIDLSINEVNITFATDQMKVNRFYSVTVSATNNAGSATSNATISELYVLCNKIMAARRYTYIHGGFQSILIRKLFLVMWEGLISVVSSLEPMLE